ncbi:glycosyltransferase family 4 protein [Curtobacterium pusillum]|uniref:D-inositol 3-phosphate glycosyltransferase n=1 Tax=Curtobacterium pusillum TaxID=69373 RepID=A0ABX2MH27_9MICO|nr:glycosyltransferase family 4 protein [Curtobacterium pusillum]NUU14584.1 glycosyltransferase family 4 protein [Curtobacterium pusillum]GLK31982.1 glycosyltransferase WbuB [Curtobacterium pusillum]
MSVSSTSYRNRVLILGLNFAPESTGIAPYTTGLAEELAKRGMEVRAITGFPHYPQWRFSSPKPPLWRESFESGVRVVRRRHLLPKRPDGLWRALSEISFGLSSVFARFGKPDVVVLVSPALISSAIGLLKVRLLTRRPTAVWVQDLYTLGLRELGEGRVGIAERAIGALERWCLRSADAVIVIHDRFRATVVEELGVAPEKVMVVRNWSHLEEAEPVDRSTARAELGWAETDFIVLHAGNMGVKQGLENVVEAARLATASGSSLRFVLLGDGNQREHLSVLAAEVPSLTMIGSLPDGEFRKALASADALLVNERSGVGGMAVPSKLTSYFSTGLPVIAATDSGSVTESEVLLAAAGPVVPAGDPQALVDAALALAQNPIAARAMGASGSQFRSTRLTARSSFDRFTQLLRGLATGRGPSSTTESGTD